MKYLFILPNRKFYKQGTINKLKIKYRKNNLYRKSQMKNPHLCVHLKIVNRILKL
jgi:hypothetical protein